MPEERTLVMKYKGQSQPYLSIFSCVNKYSIDTKQLETIEMTLENSRDSFKDI